MDDAEKLHEAETEIRQLRETVAALREELERSEFEKQTVGQKAAAGTQDEIAQLRNAAQAVRDELDSVLLDKQASIQKVRAESLDEINRASKKREPRPRTKSGSSRARSRRSETRSMPSISRPRETSNTRSLTPIARSLPCARPRNPSETPSIRHRPNMRVKYKT